MKALILGVSGQDGSYLADLLVSKRYEVHGMIRRSSSFNTGRIDGLYEAGEIKLHHGDICDGSSIRRILRAVQPDEVYNLAAQSHVRVSFEQPEYTADSTAMGTLRVLEAIRDMKEIDGRSPRLYQAGSSEMFGGAEAPQSEATPFQPRSPYAVAKVAAHQFCQNYREAYGLFICNGILFNHESPRRGETFVTRKITRALGRMKYGLQDKLTLGNLTARRDWGHAKDFVRAMWLMLQQDKADDYVVATGEAHSVVEFLHEAAEAAGVDVEGRIVFDERLVRPTEVQLLKGDASKARIILGWKPRISFKALVSEIVGHDMELARQEALLRNTVFRGRMAISV